MRIHFLAPQGTQYNASTGWVNLKRLHTLLRSCDERTVHSVHIKYLVSTCFLAKSRFTFSNCAMRCFIHRRWQLTTWSYGILDARRQPKELGTNRLYFLAWTVMLCGMSHVVQSQSKSHDSSCQTKHSTAASHLGGLATFAQYTSFHRLR